jgi:hypothetical protein
MQNIDVRDLPEPVAKAMAAMVQSIRSQMPRHRIRKEPKTSRPASLPKWRGRVTEALHRREIYDDVR